MATIRKREWQSGGETRSAWICDYRDQHGKRRLKTFTTRKAADAWLVQTRHQVSQGTHTADSISVTVAEAAQRWLERGAAEGLEESTLRQYREHVDLHIKPLIGAEKLSRLSTPRVEKFRDDLLASDRSRAMTKKVLGSLKSLIKEAQRRGMVAQNVAREVTIKASGRHKKWPEIGVDIPTKAEVRTLLDAAPARLRPLLVTVVFTGLRASELRGLRWEDVDLEGRMIRVRQRADRWNHIGPLKSGTSRRDIPMSPIVVNTLREWKLAGPKGELGLVFPNGAGKVESLANIYKRGVRPLQLRCGLLSGDGKAKYGLHAFRHFFASWLIDQGFGPKRVQALMGHSSIQITFDVYGHLFPQEDDHDRFATGELAVVG